MQKSGGRHDPLILIDIMKAFEEWMPDCKVHDNTPLQMQKVSMDGMNIVKNSLGSLHEPL
jgi:hypothetical protein